jgi:DeoR/GlpR family transcriptional regulator of sugar metabolism
MSDRQEKLEAFLREEGYASLESIAERFGISFSTARRDLEDLRQRGRIRRFRGGAIHIGNHEGILDVRHPESRCFEEKERIGRTVARMIRDGDAIAIADGTTTYQVARHLRGRAVQVVTNSLPIAALLGESRETEVILVGGSILPRADVTLGPHAAEMIRNLNVDLAILGTAGITKDGLFNKHIGLVAVHRAMMRSAERVIVAADHSKFGRKSLARLCGWSEIHHLVTNEAVDGSWIDLARARGVRLDRSAGSETKRSRMEATV